MNAPARSMTFVIDYRDDQVDSETLASLLEEALAPLIEQGKLSVRQIHDRPAEQAGDPRVVLVPARMCELLRHLRNSARR